jgi:hypothetical protein
MKLTAFFALLLACGATMAHDVGQIPSHSDPRISTGFRTAKSPNDMSRRDEAEGYREGVAVKVAHGESTVIFRSWWAASDGYHLSLVDPTDLRSIHLIWDGPVVRDNPTGDAVVWLSRENGIVLERCSSPGPQSQLRDADESEHFSTEHQISWLAHARHRLPARLSTNQKEN